MKHRLICAVLGIIMLTCQAAFSEDKPTLTVYEPQEQLMRLWRKNDSFDFMPGAYDWRVSLTEVLKGADPPDLITVSTGQEAYQALIAQGLLADLSQNADMLADYRRLRPVFQTLLRSSDGGLYGMPILVSMKHCVYWLPENWQNAGFSPEQAPDTFVDLLDFLEAWLRQPQAGCRILPESGLTDGRSYARWLHDLLTGIWSAQAQYQGQAVQFDDPAFIALASRAENIGHQLDLLPRDSGTKPLFSSRYCRGVTLDGESVTLRNLIPARIDSIQEGLMLFCVTLISVRAGSPWEEEAISCAAQAGEAQPDWARVILYTDISPEAWNTAHPRYPITKEWLDSLGTCGHTAFLFTRLPSGGDL